MTKNLKKYFLKTLGFYMVPNSFYDSMYDVYVVNAEGKDSYNGTTNDEKRIKMFNLLLKLKSSKKKN